MDHVEFMSTVKEIESQIMEEVTGSQDYMNCADHWKNDSTVNATYTTMAKQELDHAKNLNGILSTMKDLTDEQKTIIKFLIDMNSDQIRRVSNR